MDVTPDIRIRSAAEADLATIVALLADDPLGALRESSTRTVSPAYVDAFRTIQADANHELLVAELDGSVVAVLQLSFLPHLTYEGGWRGQIEGVRVDKAYRSRGVGRALLEHAVGRAADRGCHLVQLTTDRRRPQALAFYESLGFRPTHDGLKLHFSSPTREEDDPRDVGRTDPVEGSR